jgi:hypothetical protein
MYLSYLLALQWRDEWTRVNVLSDGTSIRGNIPIPQQFRGSTPTSDSSVPHFRTSFVPSSHSCDKADSLMCCRRTVACSADAAPAPATLRRRSPLVRRGRTGSTWPNSPNWSASPSQAGQALPASPCTLHQPRSPRNAGLPPRHFSLNQPEAHKTDPYALRLPGRHTGPIQDWRRPSQNLILLGAQSFRVSCFNNRVLANYVIPP